MTKDFVLIKYKINFDSGTVDIARKYAKIKELVKLSK